MDYFSEYASLGLRGLKHRNEKAAVCLCPLHKEKTPSFSINLETGAWYCFGCHKKGYFKKLVQLLKGKEYYDTKYKELDSIFFFTKKENKKVEHLSEELLTKFDVSHPYILARLKNDYALINKYQIGYSVEHDAITIPIRDINNKLLNVQLRHLGKGTKCTYLIDDNGGKSSFLYNINNCWDTSTIIITEGPFDVLRTIQNGYPNVIGLLGSALTPEQISLNNVYFTKIIIAMDDDKAGKAGSRQIYDTFVGKKEIVMLNLTNLDKKDLGDLTKVELDTLLLNTKTNISLT